MKKNFFKKLIFLILFLFGSILNIDNIVYSSSISDKIMLEIYQKNRNVIDGYLGGEKEFIEHYKSNGDPVTDKNGYRYMRLLRDEIEKKRIQEEKEKNSEGNNSSSNQGFDGSKQKEEFFNLSKHVVGNGDDDFILNMLFGTTDKSLLQRKGFLPEQGTDLYKFMLTMYGFLFSFFAIIGGLIIIYFIFFIILHYKSVLSKKNGHEFGKLEEYLIAFLIVIIVLFGGFRFYMASLKSGMKSIKEDLNSIGVETTNITNIQDGLNDISGLGK